MARIGQLFVELSLKANEFSAGLKQMQREAKEFEKSIRPIKDTLIDIGTPMVAVGGIVSAAFVGMAKQAANYGDAIRDASIRTGVSTEELSKLKFAADQSGTSFDAINAGLLRMSRSAAEAAGGTGKAKDAFKALGVSLKDATGQLRPMDAILEDARSSLSRMENGTQKAALQMQIFGKGAAGMTEFLSLTKEEMAAFSKQAEDMGLVLSRDAADAADEFNDSLDRLEKSQLGLSQTIGSALLPMLTKIVDMVTGAVVEFRKFTAAHPDLTKAIFILAGALTGAGGLLVGLAGVLLILPQLATAFAILTGPIGLAVAAVGAFAAAMYAFPKFRGIVSDTLKNVIGLFALLGSQLGSVGEALMQLATGQFSAAWNTIKNTGSKSLDAMTSALDGYDEALRAAANITGAFGGTASKTAKTLTNEFVPSLDKTSDAALKAADAAARLMLKLREPMKELDISRAFDLQPFIKQLDEINPKTKEIWETIPADTDNLEMLNNVLKGQAVITGKQIDQNARMYAANRKDIEAQTAALKRATDDVKESAGKIFDAMFIKGENVFSSLANLLKGGALSLGRAIFEDLAGALLGPIKKAFDDFFEGLLEGAGIKALVGGLGSKLGGALGGLIPGGGAAGSAVSAGTSVVSGGASAAGSAAQAGAAVASTAVSVATAALNAAGSIGVIFQLKRIEGTMNAVEKNTRYTEIQLRDTMEQILQPMKGATEFAAFDMLPEIRNTLAAIELEQQGILNLATKADAVGTAVAPVVNITFNAGDFAPQLDFGPASEIRTLDIRDKIAPELMKMYDTNVRGYGERLAQIVKERLNGLTGTEVPVGI